MDELEISGRRYISTRLAGKEHKYHADYIGQLIRAKKVAGQKVGRAWYVDAESLKEYLSQPAQTPKEVAPHNTALPTVTFKQEQEVVIEEPVELEEVAAEEAPAPAVAQEEASPIIYRTTKEAREAARHVSVSMSKTLRYVEDESPLLPQVQRQAQRVVAIRHDEPTHAPEPVYVEPSNIVYPRAEQIFKEAERYEQEERVAIIAPATKHAATKKRKGASLFARGAVVFAFGVVVFAVAAFASTHLFFTVSVDGGQSASAGYGLR